MENETQRQVRLQKEKSEKILAEIARIKKEIQERQKRLEKFWQEYHKGKAIYYAN